MSEPLAALLDPQNAPARHGEWHPAHRPVAFGAVFLTDDDGCDLSVEPREVAIMVNMAVDALAASERPPVDPLRAVEALDCPPGRSDLYEYGWTDAIGEALAVLRASLASPAAPVATLHTCWDNHEGPDGTHADGSPCRDKATPLYAAVPPEGRLTGRDVHREWRDGMLAQGREVAPERMAWETLDQCDRDLDDRIAARLAAVPPEGLDVDEARAFGEAWIADSYHDAEQYVRDLHAAGYQVVRR